MIFLDTFPHVPHHQSLHSWPFQGQLRLGLARMFLQECVLLLQTANTLFLNFLRNLVRGCECFGTNGYIMVLQPHADDDVKSRFMCVG